MAFLTADGKWLLIRHHKCGCSYASRVLLAAFGGKHTDEPKHRPYATVSPADRKGRTAVGLYRNPWEWWVSRWNYSVKEGYWTEQYSEPPTFERYLTDNLFDVKGPAGKSVEGFVSPRSRMGLYTYHLIAYHTVAPNRVLDQPGPNVLAAMREDWAVPHMLACQDLSNEMVRVFGGAVLPHLKQDRNTYPHPHYSAFYTPELRSVVADAEAIAIEWTHTEFEDEP